MMTSYLRRINSQLERFDAPLRSSLVAERGVINEAGFKLYRLSREANVPVGDLEEEHIDQAVKEAVEFILRFRARRESSVRAVGAAGKKEVVVLASRIERFTALLGLTPVVVEPRFVGCGWVDECAGDILLGDVLCEVKAGGLAFRGVDVRQILAYVALNLASRQYGISAVCLMNPRRGVYCVERVERVCFAISGDSALNVLNSIVAHISEREWLAEEGQGEVVREGPRARG